MSEHTRIDELEEAELAVIETSGRVQTLVLETLVNCGSFWPALVGWAGAVLAMKKARREQKESLSRMDYAAEITRLRHVENTNQCEIARLREELAAHEATKAQLAGACEGRGNLFASLQAAEVRVSELERELREVAQGEAVFSRAALDNALQAGRAETAIDQARGLLERAVHIGWDKNMQDESRVWLRAHPESATPAATGAETSAEQQCPHCWRIHSPLCWTEEDARLARKRALKPATPAATGAEPRRMSERRPVWSCKIGRLGVVPLPDGCDLPMRMAVREAYRRITGVEAEFIFSGWNTELTEPELAVVEDREPRAEKEQGT